MPVSFTVARGEMNTILAIVDRAEEMATAVGRHKPPRGRRPDNIDRPEEFDRQRMWMDITACHANGCPLQLDALLAARESDFAHDVFGIERHMDRETGQLMDHFRPRYARKQTTKQE